MPTFKSIDPKYIEYGEINKTFASDLECIIQKYKPNIWIHGHTHSSLDYKLYDTRIICNPKGYNNENTSFKDDFVIEI